MKTQAKFLRCNHIIRHLNEDGSVLRDEACLTNGVKSINAAKRRSRELQIANGGLGMGSLQVVDKLPKVKAVVS